MYSKCSTVYYLIWYDQLLIIAHISYWCKLEYLLILALTCHIHLLPHCSAKVTMAYLTVFMPNSTHDHNISSLVQISFTFKVYLSLNCCNNFSHPYWPSFSCVTTMEDTEDTIHILHCVKEYISQLHLHYELVKWSRYPSNLLMFYNEILFLCNVLR